MTLYRITPTTSVSNDVDAFSETDTSSSTLTVDANAFLVSDLANGAVLNGLANWTANINGLVSGAASGLSIPDQPGDAAATVRINIGKPGSVISTAAAAITSGRNTTLNNQGTILTGAEDDFAIALRDGTTNTIINSGLIAGTENEDGIIFSIVSFGSANDTLANTGTILGGVALVGGTNVITNSGKISFNPEYDSINTAIFFGDGKDTLTNSGRIDGSVILGDGTNKVVNSGRIGTTGFLENSVVGGENRDAITNTKTAVMSGSLDLGEGTNSLVNAGKIGKTFDGVSYKGGAGVDKITNSGSIAGKVNAGNGANSLTNSGVITGGYQGGEGGDIIKNLKGGSIGGFVFLGDGDNSIDNVGTLSFVNGGIGIDTLVNTGKITGFIALFGGNDIMTNTGSIGGEVDLGFGDDTFNGGKRAELVFDAEGKDKYKLGGGNDRFKAYGGEGDEPDSIDGGTGTDLYFAGREGTAAGMRINLDSVAHSSLPSNALAVATTLANRATNADGSKPDNIKNFENATGSNGFDAIYGNGGANKLSGLGAADQLHGFGGNDILIGGGNDDGDGGEDHYYGGAGADRMIGFNGSSDTFHFSAITDSGTTSAKRDRISNFQDNADVIKFDNGLAGKFNTLLARNSQFTGNDGELRTLFTATGHLIEGDIDGDRKADFSFEVRDITHAIRWEFFGDLLT